jgi:hypothetical protein
MVRSDMATDSDRGTVFQSTDIWSGYGAGALGLVLLNFSGKDNMEDSWFWDTDGQANCDSEMLTTQ